MTIQYQLVVKNGDVKSEEGNFFEGISFQVLANDNIYNCEFAREEHDVVWKISCNENVIDKLTHPDYVPESAPGEYIQIENLTTQQKIIAAAFNELKLIKDKAYIDYFSQKENLSDLDFEVVQHQI